MKKVKRNILLNPGPATTSDEVKEALIVSDICPREVEFGELLDSITKDLPKVIRANEEYTSVLFTASGTGAVEAAVSSSVPKNGKLLVVDNGAYGARIASIANRYGIDNTVYKLAYGDFPDVNKIDQILKEDKAITHLAVIDHETTTGMRNPIEEICSIAHSNNVKVIIDAMSSLGGLEINASKINAEYIVSSSNKCLQGMPGLSYVIFKKELLAELKENARSYYFDMYAQHQGFKNSGQMQFTPPVQVVYSFRKAIDMFFEEGIDKRINRYRKNYEALYEGLKEVGFNLLLEDKHQGGILIAILEPSNSEYSFNSMHDYLLEKGYTIYPGKGAKEATFRLSILGDLYIEDINNFIGELKNYIKDSGIGSIKY